MILQNIKLKMENFSNGGPVIATGAKPAYAYENGNRLDKVIGLKVSVVFPSNVYDTLSVTVADPVDRLSAALDKGAPVYVSFSGFTARMYVMNGRSGVTAKADSVQIAADDDELIIE